MRKTQFHKDNITPLWRRLTDAYPHIYLDPSPAVDELWQKYGEHGDMPRCKSDVCNLRYGFECDDSAYDHISAFTKEVDDLMQHAKRAGHNFKYTSFIMKRKFGTLRNQGDVYADDLAIAIYMPEYRAINERLYNASRTQNHYDHTP